jgi:hypothetical protein
VHAFELFDIPSQFTPHECAHLYFSHSPDWPKYAGAEKSTLLPHDDAIAPPFAFLQVFPSESITHPSGQLEITGGQSPIVFAFSMEYMTTPKNPRSKIPAIISTIR